MGQPSPYVMQFKSYVIWSSPICNVNPFLMLFLFWNILTNGLCKSSHFYDLGKHYDSIPNLIGMVGRAEKREKGEHMWKYHRHYLQCPIGAPELRVRGPGPTSIGAFKPMHAKIDSHVIPFTPQTIYKINLQKLNMI